MSVLFPKINSAPFHLESLIDEDTAMSLYINIYKCLNRIKDRESQKLSFEFLYRSCYRLTLNRYGGMLYGGVLNFLIDLLKNTNDHVCSIEQILDIWNDFEYILDTLNDVLMYLERNFVIPNTKIPIKIIGMSIFCQYYLFTENSKVELIDKLIKVIRDYRFSCNTNEKLSKNTRLIIKKLFNLPSIEIEIKDLPINTVDTLTYTDTYCNHLNRDENEYVIFKARIPIIENGASSNLKSKIILFTFKYENHISATNWNDHKIFKSFFVSYFLLETRNYYKEELERLIFANENSLKLICDYLSICEKRYFDEKKLVEDYLILEIWNELVKEMDSIWIVPFCQKYLNGQDIDESMFQLFSSGSQSDLQRLFRIMSRVPNCFENLKNSLKQYILLSLSSIISCIDSNYCKEKYFLWIKNIGVLKKRCEYIFKECFHSHPSFNHIINQSFENFFQGKNSALINGWIAFGFDTFARLCYQESNIQTTEKQFEILTWLFKFVAEKEAFENKYRTLLCKRLIEFSSQKRVVEHNILMKLRNECGHGYTIRLEGILADLMQSEILNNEYYQQNKNTIESNKFLTQVKYFILTSNYWILNPFVTCLIPYNLKVELSIFSEFFQRKYEKRKLQWHFGVGKANIFARIKKKEITYDFSFECSTLQMIILNIFNEYDYISFQEIKEKICCNDVNFLKKSIFNLSSKQNSLLKIFSKNDWQEIEKICPYLNKMKGMIDDYFYKHNFFLQFPYNFRSLFEITEEDIFCINFNAKFELIDKTVFDDNYLEEPLELTSKSTSEPNSNLQGDKCHLIDSIIVKILKKNKTLHIDDIIYRIVNDNNMLSKEHTELIISRINSLCQKEFISRDPNSNNLYNYVP